MKTAPEEVVMAEKLPAVGATALLHFLPSMAEVVVGWRFFNRSSYGVSTEGRMRTSEI